MNRICCLLLALLTFVWPAIAEPTKIQIATASWVGYTETNGEGYYFELLRRVFPEPEWQLEIQFVPFPRSLYMLEREQVDMVLGLYLGDISKGIYSAHKVETEVIDAAVTPELASVWQGMVSLTHRKRKVNEGKIDAVLDYKPDMQPLLSQLEQPRKLVLIEDVLRADVYFAFANNPKGLELKALFDQGIEQLERSGELAEIKLQSLESLQLRVQEQPSP
ncbi:ABC transporter substrate-binding protein [Shewanella chilikensis]|uniref:ABC transporter substrate-binding protein n=1 Tax=Shewanella TaxID=22 RepID=UPI001981734E|nr:MULTISPECIES: ABC transporter substrate-binding protein [Shewanella]MCL1161160.1 ABC transporter substrate-binding protein [Shewanella chilikensis]